MEEEKLKAVESEAEREERLLREQFPSFSKNYSDILDADLYKDDDTMMGGGDGGRAGGGEQEEEEVRSVCEACAQKYVNNVVEKV